MIIKLLNNHDWYYMMSDDRKVYESGLDEANLIKKLIKDMAPEEVLPFIDSESIRQLTEQRYFTTKTK